MTENKYSLTPNDVKEKLQYQKEKEKLSLLKIYTRLRKLTRQERTPENREKKTLRVRPQV